MGEVSPSDAGLASGLVNTAFMMGGAIGLAVLVSLADSRTQTLRETGDGPLVALTGGYHAAFLVAAAFALAGAIGTLLVMRPVAPPGAPPEGDAGEPQGAGEATEARREPTAA